MEPTEREPSKQLRREVERVFDDMGWENLEDIDEWTGEDLEALRTMLPDEQFQAVLDEIAEGGAHEH